MRSTHWPQATTLTSSAEVDPTAEAPQRTRGLRTLPQGRCLTGNTVSIRPWAESVPVESKLFFSARDSWVINIVFLGTWAEGEPGGAGPERGGVDRVVPV